MINPPQIPLRAALIGMSAAFMVATFVGEAQATDFTGTYVMQDAGANTVTVQYSTSGSANTIQTFRVMRAGQSDRYYRGLTNNPVMDLYTGTDANHGGTFVVSINSTGIYSPQVTVPGWSFYLADATASTYTDSRLATAKTMLVQDSPVFEFLHTRVFNDGYVYKAFEIATNDYAKSNVGLYIWVSYPGGSMPSVEDISRCVYWCEVWHTDCSSNERSCVADCETTNGHISIDWRTKCNVSQQNPPGDVN